MQLIVGRIPFLVCAPYFHEALEQPPEGVIFRDGPPSFQNQNLREGLVHLAPSSSFAYGQDSGLYGILPELCTGSTLEIRSVKMFSQLPWEALNGQPVHLTPQSATSVHLLKLIAGQFWGVQPRWIETPWGQTPCAARLLIGDEALLESEKGVWPYMYDLASLWQDWQGLPFVFGIWIVHHRAFESPELIPVLTRYRNHLAASVESFRENPGRALDRWLRVFPSPLSRDFLLRYFQIVDYGFSAAQKKSLEQFLKLCAEAGLIKQAPALRFL